MKQRIVTGVLCSIFMMGSIQIGSGIEVVNSEKFKLDINGRMQTIGFGEYLEDDWKDHLRIYLFLRQARLFFSGKAYDYNYKLSFALGGEEEVKNLNASQSLLDAYADVPAFGSAAVRVGQFKVPYGRERLADSGYLLYGDRSVQNLGFNMGRDVGLALFDNKQNFAYALGVFTAGGRDNPIRHIPERLGIPMGVLRIGFKSGLDEDVFDLKQVDAEALKPGFGFFVNGLFTKDTRVGHSSALNLKPTEKSILLNSNWNPYISDYKKPGVFWQAGTDFIIRKEVSGMMVSAEAEANYGLFKNEAGDVQLTGARTQVGISKDFWGLSLRYAFIVPDDKFAYTTKKIFTSRELIHEITPAVVLFRKKNFKIVMDAPILVDAPVVVERDAGYYLLTDQPDQTSYLATAGNHVKRQTVPEGRLVLQFSF